ncbi:hypothetical protein M9Y10_025228 [Tritrichomonas musculus]|uniref:Fungal lipase-like domain-containing protein n=1 Tax=Tritrichomonas musculus TaxID=1915356 RepID=A0ABR2H9Z2_9EUKA
MRKNASSINEDTSNMESMSDLNIIDENNHNRENYNNEDQINNDIDFSFSINASENNDDNDDDNNENILNLLNDVENTNNLAIHLNKIDIIDIINNVNLNISIYNEKRDFYNSIIRDIRIKIISLNKKIEDLSKSSRRIRIKKIKQYGSLYPFFKCKIKNSCNDLNKIIEINNLLIKIKYKTNKYFIHDAKVILNELKNIKNLFDHPDEDEFIDKLKLNIERINAENQKNRKNSIYKYEDKINEIYAEIVEKEEDEEEKEIKTFEDVLSLIPSCEGMFDKTIPPRKCFLNQTKYNIYKITVCIIISLLQLYSILYPLILGYFSIGQFFGYFFVKAFFMIRICSYNLIDICVNWKKNIKSLRRKSYRYSFYVILFLYAVVCIASIVIFIIVSKLTIFPTIDNALYIENNNEWFKNFNTAIKPDGFCYTQALYDGTLKTEDFAMMATLPRLYDINDNGKCYLKPSKRGLFNTTMKYIFGRDYENEGINIMCKKLEHNIYLVLSSEKILNQTLQNFKNKNYTLLDQQFNITNIDYFRNFIPEGIPEKGRFLYDTYKKCTLSNLTGNCENEWDIFTQFYWKNAYSDEYANITGFERYQINIDKNMIIQPSFITDDGKRWSGTHYIIGGGYEDPWNFGFFIETVGRKYIPTLLENFIPMYSFIREYAIDQLTRLEWFNKHVFYTEDFLAKELESIIELYGQFNFSRQLLFSIGHSISGTALKVMSLSTDVYGIVFEASDGETNMNYLHKSHLSKQSESESLITNVYSNGAIITGNDEKCNVNGILPKRYNLPSVYDTACLAAISCSTTKKYVPFCQQILNQNRHDPIKEFNNSFDNFLKHYGLN